MVPEAAGLTDNKRALLVHRSLCLLSGSFQVGHPELRTGPAPESTSVARASPGASPAPALSVTHLVTLHKNLPLSESQFHHLKTCG